MTDAPRSLVSNSNFPLKLYSRYTMTTNSEQVHGVEPLLKRCTGLLKWRSNHGVNMVATPRTLISREFLDSGKIAVLTTLMAVHRFTMANKRKVIQTAIVIRELLKELDNNKVFGFSHVVCLH